MTMRDPRLNVTDPLGQRHLDVTHPASEEAGRIPGELITLLVDALLGEPAVSAVPVGLEQEIVEAYQTIRQAIDGGRELPRAEGARETLLNRLGATLADRCRANPERWETIFSALERLGAWSAEEVFVARLDPDAVLASLGGFSRQLTQEQAFRSLDTFGWLRDASHQAGYLEELASREARGGDRWSFVEWAARPSGEVGFDGALRFRAALHRKAGLVPWLEWVGRLPLLFLQAIALRDVQSLDEAQEIMGRLLLESSASEDVRILAAMRLMELWATVGGNLARVADKRLIFRQEDEPRRAQAAESLAEWREHELPSRMAVFGKTCVNAGETGRRVASGVLRNHFVSKVLPPRHRSAEDEDIPAIREKLIGAFLEGGVSLSVVLDGLFHPSPTRASLLSAAILVLEASPAVAGWAESADRVWRAYSRSLMEPDAYWHWPEWLVDDDLTLAWVLGGVLGSAEVPSRKLADLLRAVHLPPDGWRFEHSRWFESRSQVAHVLVVGSMAAEWLKKAGKTDLARATFSVAWRELDRWLRQVDRLGQNCELTAIGHVWARLWYVEGPEGIDLALPGLGRMDKLDWVLGAAEALRNNQGQGGSSNLDNRIQNVLNERIPPMLELARRSPGLPEDELATLEDRVRRLAIAK